VVYVPGERLLPRRDPELAELTEQEEVDYGRYMGPRYRPGVELDRAVNVLKRDAALGILAERQALHNAAAVGPDSLHDIIPRILASFAGGTLGRLNAAGNSLQLMIYFGDASHSVPFDSLGSGQKEIITTLYLIWRHTRGTPSVVLIDEPELHLNAQWHGQFVDQLRELAPWNQYILATHSADIMGSVPDSRRVLLVP
jgi:hypothetical protein